MTSRWWEDFFDSDFVEGFSAADLAIPGDVAFLQARFVGHAPTVFDQCCGYGRIALPLAHAGFAVTGVDQCEDYIARAQRAADDCALSATFVRADAYQYVCPMPHANAICWGTSFGYLSEDSQAIAMARSALWSVVPGGQYVVEYYALPHLIRTFEASRTTAIETPSGTLTVHRTFSVSWSDGVLTQRWRYEREGRASSERVGHTRMYMPRELRDVLLRAGFESIELFGGANHSEFTDHSSRMIMVARRPYA
ncbi:MAG: class I SAM-dependent methyltransferase [Deltaproteobacteria bacterium]|nr:class I SAM-dependent methyltransferase [Deltaproteobacteria bacterium]